MHVVVLSKLAAFATCIALMAVSLALSAQAEPFRFLEPDELERPEGMRPVSYLLVCGQGIHVAPSKHKEPHSGLPQFDLQTLPELKGGQMASMVIRTDDWERLVGFAALEWANCPK